jgi:predicted metal-dependent peptidase
MMATYALQKNILDSISEISFRLIIHEPFYGHFFSGLIKEITEKIPTLAVGSHQNLIILFINPTFWQEELNTHELKMGVLKHEILHIVLKHIFRHQGFNHKEIFNVAADLVVNQYINRSHLTPGAVFLDNFPELELKPHEHVNYYYDKLLDLYKNFCNAPTSEDGIENQAWSNLKNLLKSTSDAQSKHTTWQEIDEMGNAEKDILEAAINQSLENTLQRTKRKDFDTLPGQLQEYLQAFQLSLIPTINWKRLLRIFANNSSRTKIKNTLRRPSKRYGTNPGIKVLKKQKLLVALDTSGSIEESELEDFFSEIYHIWKQGAEILVVECDTQIQQQYMYKGTTPSSVNGRGGTDFNAPLTFANEQYHPDGLIYFTDGEGPKPQIFCNSPILWVITKQGVSVDSIQEFQGRKIKIN